MSFGRDFVSKESITSFIDWHRAELALQTGYKLIIVFMYSLMLYSKIPKTPSIRNVLVPKNMVGT